MEEIQLEIEVIRTHIKTLQKERSSLTVKTRKVVTNSPEAIPGVGVQGCRGED